MLRRSTDYYIDSPGVGNLTIAKIGLGGNTVMYCDGIPQFAIKKEDMANLVEGWLEYCRLTGLTVDSKGSSKV